MRAEYLAMPELRDASWRYHVRTSDHFEFSFAFHREYELVLIAEGAGQRLVGDSSEPYGPGDLVLIAPELPHTWVSAPGVTRNAAVIVQFGREWGSSLWSGPEFAAITGMLDESRRGLAFDRPPRAVTRTLRDLGDLSPARRTLSMLGVLQTLAEQACWRTLASVGYPADLDEDSRRRVDAACRFLRSAHGRRVVLAEVAQMAHMSPSAFSRFFRRAMGRSLTDYLNELRVATACRLLVDTELPIIEVASRSGYRNLSHFNRQFRRRKEMPPRAYRASFRA